MSASEKISHRLLKSLVVGGVYSVGRDFSHYPLLNLFQEPRCRGRRVRNGVVPMAGISYGYLPQVGILNWFLEQGDEALVIFTCMIWPGIAQYEYDWEGTKTAGGTPYKCLMSACIKPHRGSSDCKAAMRQTFRSCNIKMALIYVELSLSFTICLTIVSLVGALGQSQSPVYMSNSFAHEFLLIFVSTKRSYYQCTSLSFSP